VRIGTHRLTGTRVALKQIPKSVSAQLTREIHHHRQLHHPHVVQLYEVIATETSIWLVTELCAGGELFDYLVEQGRIDEFEARTLFGQLCLAVAYCHNQGVVHRDLKLENVLLDDHCQVKLSDFGFTREFERGTLMDTFCGTTGYASPEMLMGQKYLGQGLSYPPYPNICGDSTFAEVDIWSLGIILYALLTGALPFDDDDEQEMKNKILAGEFEDPEWLSSGMYANLLGCELTSSQRLGI
jgi:serine/threonine protein kinase